MREFLALVAPTLASQHSLITTPQIAALGGHHEYARRLVQRGVWERIDVGLYGPVGVAMYWRRQLMAAVLLAPARSLVSHRCGASLLGVGGLHEPTPEITIPNGASLRRKDVVVHESTDLDLAGILIVDGLPVTDIPRLAVDLGSVVSPHRYRQTMREIRFGARVPVGELVRTYLRHKARGRNGCGALRDWLDRYSGIQGVPESALEQMVLDAIIDAGLPRPVLQFWVSTPSGRYRLDLAYPADHVAIEVNGSQHEDDPEVAANDVVRTAALVARGWTVLVVRSRSFTADLTNLIAELRGQLGHSV